MWLVKVIDARVDWRLSILSRFLVNGYQSLSERVNDIELAEYDCTTAVSLICPSQYGRDGIYVCDWESSPKLPVRCQLEGIHSSVAKSYNAAYGARAELTMIISRLFFVRPALSMAFASFASLTSPTGPTVHLGLRLDVAALCLDD